MSSQRLSVLAIGPARGGVGDSFGHTAATLAADPRLRLAVARVPERTRSALAAVRAVGRARRAIRRADAVHIEFGTNDRTAFWFALGATFLTRRALLVIHDYPEFAKNPAVGILGDGGRWTTIAGHRLLSPLLDRLLGAVLLRRAGAVAVMSAEARDGIRTRARRYVIPHGSIPASAARVAPSDGEYVLFAGYLGPPKGVDILLEAWNALTDPSLELRIAADPDVIDDPSFAELCRTAAGGRRPPRWVGFMDSESSLQDAIAQAAVVALPYRRSAPGSGMLARAMTEGRAIVASAVPAMQAAIQTGTDGLLVPPEDPAALADALSAMLADPALRDRLGASAGRRGAELFSSARQAEILIGAYGELTAP